MSTELKNSCVGVEKAKARENNIKIVEKAETGNSKYKYFHGVNEVLLPFATISNSEKLRNRLKMWHLETEETFLYWKHSFSYVGRFECPG